ncbi:DUF4381 domain-containing protein [Ningiella sp. W23]|uniref:DUF4381 domain-containing protein n=1 Tax=Ningiella sp. W23 TaxID=3023715 RepID=UPI0037577EB5
MNPLDQLADIRTPDNISVWPLAMGYWIAAALIILALALTLWQIMRRKRRLAAKKDSLVTMASIDLKDANAKAQIHQVLKKSVQAYLPEENVLQMSSTAWQDFIHDQYSLRKKRSASNETIETLIALANWQYDQRIDLPDNQLIHNAAMEWMALCLPPKAQAIVTKNMKNPAVNAKEANSV